MIGSQSASTLRVAAASCVPLAGLAAAATAASVLRIHVCRIAWLASAMSGSLGLTVTSRHLRTVLLRRPDERAIAPARSTALSVRSRWSSERVSGRHSAIEMAPSAVRPVSDRKSRLRDVLVVRAVRRAWIYEISLLSMAR